MKLRIRRSRISILEGVSILCLVCLTGFEFIESWHRHAPHRVGDGVFFALALILMQARAFEFKVGDSGPQSER